MTANVTSPTRRVLVADDDPVTRRLVSSVLVSEGYTPVEAEDGYVALRRLHGDSNFRAAIFDMMMPRLEGLDVLRYMGTEKRLKRIPVILMTAETDLKLLGDCLASGAMAFLPKPLRPDRLRVMLQTLEGQHG